jgi:PAS domain S-box-containing protein
MDPEFSGLFQRILDADGPVTFGQDGDYPITEAMEQYKFQSQICMPLYPRKGKPWLLGLHHCSGPRSWLGEEKKLFVEAGRRLEEALTSLLAYRELQESEGLYRSLFENMLNGWAYCRLIFEGDIPVDFVFLEANSAFATLTGWKDVVGKKMSEVTITSARQAGQGFLNTAAQVVFTGKPERFEYYAGSLDKWLSMSVYSPQRNYFVVVFDDITDRKNAEEKLRKSEEMYRLITDNISDILFTTDA